MYEQFRQTPINPTRSYGANTITIQKIEQNAKREPKIKLNNSVYRFTGYWSSLNIYAYVGFQALSKLLDAELITRTYEVYGNDDNLKRDIDNLITWLTENAIDKYCVTFVSLAPSNIRRGPVKRARESIGDLKPEIDNMLMHESQGSILGVTLSNDMKHLLIFINKGVQLNNINQILLLSIIYRMIGITTTAREQKEYALFNDLTNYFARHEQEQDRNEDYERLHLIFLNYVCDLPEYTIDRTDAVTKLILQLRENKFKQLKRNADSARSDLESALSYLEECRKRYDETNFLYMASKTAAEEDDTKKQLEEALDLIKRSPRIIKYDFDNTILWFTMKQPLSVNDKDNWIRISRRIFPEKERECINKALVDEEFELWAGCTVSFDFERNKIMKYNASQSNANAFENAIPHPHISNYGCFGQHSSIIGNLIAEGNYIAAIEQAIEAGSGLNWSDGAVTDTFANRFLKDYRYIKCFKAKNGTWFSLEQYLGGERFETIQENDVETDVTHI